MIIQEEENKSEAVSDELTIDRRTNLSYDEFQNEYLFPRKPVIITDATSKWKASEWTPQWFKERYAEKMVKTDQGLMRMGDFIDEITRDSDQPGPFLREQPIKDIFPDLMDHVSPMPAYVRPNWLGANYYVGSISKRLNRESHLEVNFCGRRIFPYLHVDDLGVHAFITQHYGDKNLIVYPPDQEPFLYRNENTRFSKIYDVDKPDLDNYPLFKNAKAIRVVLKAGETAFMPSGWWHTTKVPGTSLSTVISVSNSSNWKDLIQFYKKNSSNTKKALLIGAYLRGMGFLQSITSNK
ncbi:cupin-like domain-containing protein [Pedobacter heparinus]|uniref:cupin-like domain-containing protein n=1 Tax=Pedobacter heparinus TaxID=984 RepID=UPI00292CE0C2|nr:cupin-like domain-containing protein [Pedobacter heparinus]